MRLSLFSCCRPNKYKVKVKPVQAPQVGIDAQGSSPVGQRQIDAPSSGPVAQTQPAAQRSVSVSQPDPVGQSSDPTYKAHEQVLSSGHTSQRQGVAPGPVPMFAQEHEGFLAQMQAQQSQRQGVAHRPVSMAVSVGVGPRQLGSMPRMDKPQPLIKPNEPKKELPIPLYTGCSNCCSGCHGQKRMNPSIDEIEQV